MNNIYLYLSNGVNPNKLNWDGRAMRTHEEIWIGAVKWHHREWEKHTQANKQDLNSTWFHWNSCQNGHLAVVRSRARMWRAFILSASVFESIFYGGQRPNQENTDSVSQMFGEIRKPSGKRLHNYGKIHNFQWENPLSLWPCSLAMLNYQRVYIYIYNVMWYYGIAWDVYNGNIIYIHIYIYGGSAVSWPETNSDCWVVWKIWIIFPYIGNVIIPTE